MTINFSMLGILVVVLGFLPLSNGAQKYLSIKQFMDSSLGVEATVIDHREVTVKKHSKTSRLFYDVVRFEDANSVVKEAAANVGSYPIAHPVGERISIRFSLDDADDVRIDSMTGIWLEAFYYLVPGLLMILGGGWLIHVGKKRNRRT